MQGSQHATPPEVVTLESSPSARIARVPIDLASRIGDAAWGMLHVMGAHRWREGYETDSERGWSRYRGTRCTICDEPWEGW
jgi:hypothetical protein